MTLTSLCSRFKWTADGRLDTWRILSLDATGHYRGDCDDFAVTASRFVSGSTLRMAWNIATMQHVIWYTRLNGSLHVMLWCRGRGWIDNTTRKWGQTPPHKKMLPALPPLVALKIALGKLA